MAVPTVPAAKDALLAALLARPGLADVQVSWAHPGADLIKREAVYFGDTEYETSAKSLGNRERHEEYTIEVVVSVHQSGNDPRGVEIRCWEILNEIEDELRANDDLGESVRIAEFTAAPVRLYVGARERIAESVVQVSVSADI